MGENVYKERLTLTVYRNKALRETFRRLKRTGVINLNCQNQWTCAEVVRKSSAPRLYMTVERVYMAIYDFKRGKFWSDYSCNREKQLYVWEQYQLLMKSNHVQNKTIQNLAAIIINKEAPSFFMSRAQARRALFYGAKNDNCRIYNKKKK